MSKKAPAKVGGRCRSDERRLFRGLPVWLILTFALGILTHKVVFNRGEPQREVGQEIEAPESLSRGGGSMIGEYESIEAVLMCAMIGTGVESQMMVDLVRALHRKVRVVVLVNSVEQVSECRRLLSQAGIPAGGVDLLRCNANSPWLRDYGPLFVRKADGKIAAVESAYLRSADSNNLNLVLANDEFAIALSNGLDLEVDSLPILLDGGNFISNGGRLVCTTTRVLAANRARGFDANRLDRLFKRKFGELNWIMTPALDGEPTGHVDIFLTFLARDLAVVGRMDPSTEPVNAARLDQFAATLRAQRVGKNQMQVLRVPVTRNGEVWRSYCNVVIANGTILVPSFADSADSIEAEVMKVYRAAMPSAEVVPVTCDSLLGFDGLLHCMTLTLPRGIALDGLKAALIPCP
ncbi:MAG: agmatine deiminase family protein [Roseibacillus sp.]